MEFSFWKPTKQSERFGNIWKVKDILCPGRENYLILYFLKCKPEQVNKGVVKSHKYLPLVLLAPSGLRFTPSLFSFFLLVFFLMSVLVAQASNAVTEGGKHTLHRQKTLHVS